MNAAFDLALRGTILRGGAVTMGAGKHVRMGTNEVGAAICRLPSGGIVFGPKAEGTPMSVSVPIQCPPGSSFAGIWHTHPGGVAVPSKQDLRSGRSVGAKRLCITVPETGETRCYGQK